VAGYRADIEIGVKGLRDLQAFRREVDLLSKGITAVNNNLGGAAQSVDNYNRNLQEAARNLNAVNAGTIAERDAVRQYVTALGESNAARNRQNKLIQDEIDNREQSVRLAERELQISKQSALLAGRFSPIGGTEDLPGSPAALKAREKRRKEAISNAVIGGAFPLLFGQGPGAALGGGLGGAAGGLAGGQFGFGLSLVGTAAGAAIDTLIQKTTELGGALLDNASTFDTLKERALIANRELEKNLTALEEAGFAATANAVAQKELYKTIGVNGVERLKELGSEADKLNRVWAELGAQIQAVVAGPLTDLAKALNDLLSPKAVANRVAALRSDLSPQERAKLNKELLALGGPGSARFGAQKNGLNVLEIELAARKFPEKVQEILDKYGALRVDAEVKFNRKQLRQETVNILQRQLEILDITKKFTEAAEEQLRFDKRRYELIENYENAIAAIRRRVDDEVEKKRITAIQKENELLEVQARIRQEGLSLANLQAQGSAGRGLPTAARNVAREAAEAAGTFAEKELSLAEQTAKLKRDAALDALRTDLEAAKFQADISREVNKLNIDTAKRIADLNDEVRKKNAQQDTRRFEIEKQLSLLRLETIEQELNLLKEFTKIAGSTPLFVEVSKALVLLKESRTGLQQARPPAALTGGGGPALQGVSFAGLNTVNDQLKLTQERTNAAQLALNDLFALKNEAEFTRKLENIAEKIDAPLVALNEELAKNEATRTRYAELIKKGIRGAVAERIIELEQLREAAILQNEAVIAELEKRRAIEGTSEALEAQIKKFKERRAAIEGRVITGAAAIDKEESPRERIKGAVIEARKDLTELIDTTNQVKGAADAVGNAFQQSFKDLISGTQTAQEALAQFFKNVGDYFLDTASKIIGKLIEIFILEQALGFITGRSATSGPIAPNGKEYYGPAFAEGGFVTGPTRALIGEGGESEYVIPASKMKSAMNRYAAGARGNAVLSGGDETSGGGMATMAPAAIDVRYNVERINNVDYVTNQEFQAGLQQAATQGAERGQQLALRRLQQSVTTRRRLGI